MCSGFLFLSMKLSDLTSQERATYRRFIDKQLNKGMALAPIRLMLEKQGVDSELARELVKMEGLRHAKSNMQKAYLSIGAGILLTLIILFNGIVVTKHLELSSVLYSFSTLIGGLVGFFIFYKRYKYLKSLD